MILLDSENGITTIEGNADDLLAELIYLEKFMQKEWRKRGREETFNRIIRNSLVAEELEVIMKGD